MGCDGVNVVVDVVVDNGVVVDDVVDDGVDNGVVVDNNFMFFFLFFLFFNALLSQFLIVIWYQYT
jgi:hypothetical protein